jgi:S-formylglutathione hydrolase
MLELLSEHACFGGVQRFYRHTSIAIGLAMRFSVFLPPQAGAGKRPVPGLFFLAGLTCTEETFMTKAGAQRYAAEHGIALIAPDTSPRGAGIEGEADAWDLGVGAGFYLDASAAPWRSHYRMHAYLVEELRELSCAELPIDAQRLGIFGHSMGGHGALVLALRHPGVYRSVSALAPIAAPMQCPWGVKAFSAYLGEDRELWREWDASELVRRAGPVYPDGILVDQGLSDQFLQTQLHPEIFEAACRDAAQPLTLRRHTGYDHGYYFVSTFIADHLAHHARALSR